MKDTSLYAELLAKMKAATNGEFLADLTRFVDSYADHDDDCPGYSVFGRDLLDEVRLRLSRV